MKEEKKHKNRFELLKYTLAMSEGMKFKKNDNKESKSIMDNEFKSNMMLVKTHTLIDYTVVAVQEACEALVDIVIDFLSVWGSWNEKGSINLVECLDKVMGAYSKECSNEEAEKYIDDFAVALKAMIIR